MNARQSFVLLLLAALWGSSFLFLRVAVPEFGPIWLIEWRVLLAGLALLPLVLWHAQLAQVLANWRHLLVVGLLNAALPFVLIAYAAMFMSAGMTSIVNATVPIFSVLFARLVLHERLSTLQLSGIALGFFGVVLLVSWPQQGLMLPPYQSVLAGLAGAASYVLAAHYTKRYLAGVRPMPYVVGSQLSAAIILLPLLPFFTPPSDVSINAVFSVVGLALLSTSLAFKLYFDLLHQVGPTQVLTVTYLIPVFAIFWGWLFLSEPLGLPIVSSCVLIILGTALANRRVAPA